MKIKENKIKLIKGKLVRIMKEQNKMINKREDNESDKEIEYRYTQIKE